MALVMISCSIITWLPNCVISFIVLFEPESDSFFVRKISFQTLDSARRLILKSVIFLRRFSKRIAVQSPLLTEWPHYLCMVCYMIFPCVLLMLISADNYRLVSLHEHLAILCPICCWSHHLHSTQPLPQVKLFSRAWNLSYLDRNEQLICYNPLIPSDSMWLA